MFHETTPRHHNISLPFLVCSVTGCSSCESDPNMCDVCNEGLKLNPVKTACTIEDCGRREVHSIYGTDILAIFLLL